MGSVQQPRLTDVVAIKALLDEAADAGSVLPRDLADLYTNVRDLLVYKDDQGVGGVVALHIDMIDLAEVRSLVVRDDLRGTGVGGKLVEAVVNEARTLDISRVYALTRVPGFFLKLGFHEVDHMVLPYKVFKDCLKCRLFPGCDEVALIKNLNNRSEQADMALSEKETN
jgi:amino-acid N-acetyltransferase